MFKEIRARSIYLGPIESEDLIKMARQLCAGGMESEVLAFVRKTDNPQRELIEELALRLEKTLERRERELAHDQTLGHNQY